MKTKEELMQEVEAGNYDKVIALALIDIREVFASIHKKLMEDN